MRLICRWMNSPGSPLTSQKMQNPQPGRDRLSNSSVPFANNELQR